MPAEGAQGEPARASMRNIHTSGTSRAQLFFWIDHEDVFRKSP
jgi:hypothetical protein